MNPAYAAVAERANYRCECCHATVLRLQMNLSRQLAARLRWMRFGLFP
jgi:hypothetical protein